MEKKERLKELIRRDALRIGDFVLASGRKSNYYINGKMVTLQAEGLSLIGELFHDIALELGADAVGGPTLGADPIVGAILAVAGLREKPLDGFIVRKAMKNHGTRSLIEGPLKEGSTVMMVEDVVTTAGTWLKAAEEVRGRNCRVAAMVCLVDREESARENLANAGYRFMPLFRKSDFGV